jgi:hypothetical protein
MAQRVSGNQASRVRLGESRRRAALPWSRADRKIHPGIRAPRSPPPRGRSCIPNSICDRWHHVPARLWKLRAENGAGEIFVAFARSGCRHCYAAISFGMRIKL